MVEKWVLLGFLATVLALASGCAQVGNSLPAGSVPLQELKTTATYDIIGPAEGTSTVTMIFGIPCGAEQKYGTIAGAGFTWMSPVMRAALYNAIDSVPGADTLLAPRWKITREEYVFYQKVTAHVRGKAVRYNVSAK